MPRKPSAAAEWVKAQGIEVVKPSQFVGRLGGLEKLRALEKANPEALAVLLNRSVRREVSDAG